MAALSVTNPTLLDLARAQDPDGSIGDVAEILNQTNTILQDMTFVEGNLTAGHRSLVRVGSLPAPTWRKINEGVLPNKGQTVAVTDGTGEMTAYSEVDKKLADMSGNVKAFRMLEDRAHIEGMNQEAAQTLIFGNADLEPETFTGFAPRFNSLSGINGENIINASAAGGQTDLTSIWLVVWSPMTVFGIVPKGSKAGLQVHDKGLVTVENAGGVTGARMEAYRTNYQWDLGLVVKDWRYVVRIANIDKSALLATAASGANLPNLMHEAYRQVPNLSMGRAVFYMSRYVETRLQQQLSTAVKESSLTVENVGGVITERFHGIPLRRVDALAADEAAVA